MKNKKSKVVTFITVGVGLIVTGLIVKEIHN